MEKKDFEFDIDEDDNNRDIAKRLKKLKGKIDGLAIAFLFVGFMGFISLICGIFVGRSSDPGDYYGTYYAVFDSTYVTYHISEEDSYCEMSCGFDLVDSEVVEFTRCEYLNAKKAQNFIQNEDYDGCDALALYIDENNAHFLWIINDSPYEFVLNANGTKFTETENNFKKDMEDPCDYYCTYTYNEYNKITFNKDGTADFCFNGKVKEYKFVFVNEDWNSKWMRNNDGCALVVYSSDNVHVFIYEDNKTLTYNNFEFTGSGSSLVPSPDDDSDDLPEDEDSDKDNDDAEDNNTNDSSSGTTQTPDWSELLDYSNITLKASTSDNSNTLYMILKIKDEKYRLEISYDEDFDSAETVICYTDGLNSYYITDGEKINLSRSEAMEMCESSFTDYIDGIDVDDITKVSNSKYSTENAEIYLGNDGKIEKIVFHETYTIEFSKQGSTIVSKP